MNCFSWNPRLSWACSQRNKDGGSPCSPSSYAAESSMGMRRRSEQQAAGGTTRKFTLAQLWAATDGFHESNLVGEGGFGRVYRGRLLLDGLGVGPGPVAVKQLCRGGAQGTPEFLVECMMLMMLHHPNLVSLVGYCSESTGERLLVYEFLPRGSLDAHLFPGGRRHDPLCWDARVRIALGAARGLRYLHEVVTPPVIYRDLKSSNILLADDLTPKLSDFGLAKLGPVGDDTHVSTRVMGTYGYCAPDYAMSGKLNVKSDVYSFGVVLLELITGRRAFDAARSPPEEQRLLVWARPYLAGDRKRCFALADPLLQGRYPRRAFYQLAVVTSLCLRDNPNLRPSMTDVTQALEHVASQPWQHHHNQRPTPDVLRSTSSSSPHAS
ncbi:probable serine/threonine-protein kinase PBL7 [Oryza brachyantha]|uniref:Protein kinase domain-containing protein n=1 Tax=Oryza brachyantha TaxID=4533 RepID=J3LIS6_ORYBR|nr:probable serine/threonine-protein kinase PBL7 [Oryza brachyantha]